MAQDKKKISSGLSGLDRVLNGLYIGDNVIWHDTAGSLAMKFCLAFIKASRRDNKSLVYVSFDRSPKNLIENLGTLAQHQQLTILDCFTNGKGDNAQIFNKFYEKDGAQWPYQVIKITRPENPEAVLDAILGLHKTLANDVRFVFESLTGMADLWQGEDQVLRFYSHTCPRLYELDTIAYWILEKEAHSGRLRAHINQIAQAAVDLSMARGETRFKVIKAENRSPKMLGKPLRYSWQGEDFLVEGEKQAPSLHDLGGMIRTFRKHQGMSQKELSRLVGVTPSNISQIETNQVFPSVPALYRIAEHLSVHVRAFFQDQSLDETVVFPAREAVPVQVPRGSEKKIEIVQITPLDLGGKAQVFLVFILPSARLNTHFFSHKGEEMGYVLSGQVDMVFQEQRQSLKSDDLLYFMGDCPSQWINRTREPVRLLWVNLKA